MAKQLRVAMLVNVSRRYDRRAAQGVAAYARDRGGWNLYIEEDPLAKLPRLDRWNGDGIIANFDERRVAQAVSGLKIPVVAIGSGHHWYDPHSGIPYLTTDNHAIGRLAAEHLLDCGFSRLAFFGNPPDRRHPWSHEREQAFQERARSADVSCTVYLGHPIGAQHWIQQLDELANWLKELERPVGVFAGTDICGRQILEACQMVGLRVPTEVAVVGVDNDEMICELTSPPLSSIEQGSMRIGYEAAELLDRLIEGRSAGTLRRVIAPETLVKRQTTDVLACEDTDLATVIRYIREHACDPIRVANVLDAMPLSRSTLEKRFQATLGRSLHAEIRRVQVERAQQLLTNTSLLVKQVAQRCGFRHVPAMNRVFREHVGQTPAEYRRVKMAGGRLHAGEP
jgi:LacI family transcriptional regulator